MGVGVGVFVAVGVGVLVGVDVFVGVGVSNAVAEGAEVFVADGAGVLVLSPLLRPGTSDGCFPVFPEHAVTKNNVNININK